MFRRMPFILLFIFIAIVLLDNLIPIFLKQCFYATSLSIKSVIIFFLPFIIFGLLFRSAVTMSKNASWVIGLIFICVCCSNFFSTFLSHYVGSWIYSFDHSIVAPNGLLSLQPLWSWELPKLIANEKAMFSGIALGVILSYVNTNLAQNISGKLELVVNNLLKAFTLLIPIFVTGFMIKLQFDGVVAIIVKDYTLIFAVVALAQFVYILLAYFLLAHGKFPVFLSSLKNMLPAAISGFSTMSSAAAMPLTLIGVQKNTQNKDLAKSVVPATVNVHLIGDCFAIPIFAYAILKNYDIAEPAMMDYLIFAFYFVLAKFSVAAIPGGGIIVMLPILESNLGFTAEMMSLITALYILFDPVITSANVLGNGAFAKLIDRLVLFTNTSKTESIPVTKI